MLWVGGGSILFTNFSMSEVEVVSIKHKINGLTFIHVFGGTQVTITKIKLAN